MLRLRDKPWQKFKSYCPFIVSYDSSFNVKERQDYGNWPHFGVSTGRHYHLLLSVYQDTVSFGQARGSRRFDPCSYLVASTGIRTSADVLSHRCMENPGQIEREEYRKALQGYAQIEVPSWHDEVSIHAEAHLKA